MSTDWNRYSTPKETRERGRDPVANGVIALPVGPVRTLSLRVDHSPQVENRAHTDVGMKTTEVRLHLLRLADWVLQVQ